MILSEIKAAIGVKPYFEEEAGVIYCADCLEILPRIPDKAVDLVLTDPPYGIRIAKKSNKFGVAVGSSRVATMDSWDDNIPDKQYFNEIFRASRNQIVFGANYFWGNFYATQCYIVWDKRGDLPDVPFAPTEFAWTSFRGMSKKYTCINHGFIAEDKTPKVHPTMKPLPLFLSIVADFSKDADLILDPFLGSGTTAVAAKQLGRKYIGIEISEKYCAVAVQRLAQEILI